MKQGGWKKEGTEMKEGRKAELEKDFNYVNIIKKLKSYIKNLNRRVLQI